MTEEIPSNSPTKPLLSNSSTDTAKYNWDPMKLLIQTIG